MINNDLEYFDRPIFQLTRQLLDKEETAQFALFVSWSQINRGRATQDDFDNIEPLIDVFLKIAEAAEMYGSASEIRARWLRIKEAQMAKT